MVWALSWPSLLLFTVYDSVVCLLYEFGHVRWIDVPWGPVATLGTAVAFYIGFKSNGSYDRFWEGRQLWGTIVNVSRTWSIRVFHFVEPMAGDRLPDTEEVRDLHQRLLYRQIAWVNALRLHLRGQTAELWDSDVAPFLDDAEDADVRRMNNPPTHLLRHQSDELRLLHQRGLLTEYRHVALMDTIQDMFNAQGGCERIKNTPFPRQYAFFSFLFVWVFAAVLPLGLLSEFAKMGPGHIWLLVPVAVLVSGVFNTIELVGHTSENPFDNQINDVPMTAICRSIEIDLRELLAETDLPAKVVPVNDILF
ncbi:bestrophin family ion channel [Hymenobacter humi]